MKTLWWCGAGLAMSMGCADSGSLAEQSPEQALDNTQLEPVGELVDVRLPPEMRNREAALAAFHFAHLGIRTENLLERVREQDEMGVEHVRLQQEKDGIPVKGGDISVHSKDDLVVLTSGTLANIGDVDTTPELTAEDAEAALFAHLSETNPALKKREMLTELPPAPRLMIVPTKNGARLTWQLYLEVRSQRTTMTVDGIVDAHTGEVLQAADARHYALPAQGTANTLFDGDKSFRTMQRDDGLFVLNDAEFPGSATRLSGKSSAMTSKENSWGNNATGSNKTLGSSVHWAVERTLSYFSSTFGRKGMGNDGKGIVAYVDSPSDGVIGDSAYYSPACDCVAFGAGADYFSPLVALDIVAHEVTHQLTAKTAGLDIVGEPGALSESTSDIFAILIEHKANPNWTAPDYRIAEDAYNLFPFFLRSLKRPTDDGISIDHYRNYTSGLDAHFAAGIPNNFFYLLSAGGRNATSDVSVAGIGRPKAAKIWYRALTKYFTSTTNFKGACRATMQAAADLHGKPSPERDAVKKAWSAVGVNCW